MHPGIDDAETICAEFYRAMSEVIERMPHVQRMTPRKAAPVEQNTVPAEWLEQAYREGWAACRDAETIGEEAEDWAFGNSTANSRMIDAQQAAPQQEAQEPTEIPEEIERMAADRYKVVPSHESMFHRWAVVAGTGTQQLYLGREVECQNMARKFAGAFLDGAFVAMQRTAPQPAPHLPERDASLPAERQGLFRKFVVGRVDGSDKPGGKHHGCTYFVLDVDHDPCARPALAAYAAACESTHPTLAADLRTKWGVVPAPQPSPAPLSESIDQLARKLEIIGVVGVVDGHDVVRRESVLEIARRAALAAQGATP